MKANLFLRLALLAAAAAAAASCIYPFHPDVQGSDTRIVIEGSILAGASSTFSFSNVHPIGTPESYQDRLSFTGYIEGEDGSRIRPAGGEGTETLVFDTSDLPETQRYRVHFEDTKAGRIYESDWLEVCPAPVIDDLSYIMDKERGELDVALSMHCQGQSHFRWSYTETWEYSANRRATYYFDPQRATAMGNPLSGLLPFEHGENIYYCWSTRESPEIKIFDTSEQKEDRFVDLEFHRIPRYDQRLQILYRLDVRLEALSQEAYLYWKNIEDNSQNQGTIFSPTPSQMAGNIRCVTDPTVPVIGYINACHQATARMYYDNNQELFSTYRVILSESDLHELDPKDFFYYHQNQYIVLSVLWDSPSGPVYTWVPKGCADCRTMGGTKDKPAGWPNDHK